MGIYPRNRHANIGTGWMSSFGLRLAMAEAEKTKAKAKAGKEGVSDELRKQVHGTHRYVFLLAAYCMAIISGVTLLLESAFHCENIANKCYLSYIVAGAISTTVSLVWLKMDFCKLVILFWLLLISLIAFVPVVYYGKGNIARITFILLNGSIGIFEPPILQASTFVISKLFLNSAISTLYSGYMFGVISMGLFQLIVERIIGTSNVPQMRLCATLCYGVRAAVGVLTGLWITYLYFQYKDKAKQDGGGGKTDQLIKVVKIMPYYAPRIVIQEVGSFMRVFFYPYLLPFLVDLSSREKLIISLTFTLFDFLGTNYAGQFDETIDPSGKAPSQSHLAFILSSNLQLYILGFSVILTAGFLVWNIWSAKFGFAKSPLLLLAVAAVNGFIGGFSTGRGLNGLVPLVQYYNKQNNENRQKIIDDETMKTENIVNDVVMAFDYFMCFFLSICSNTAEQIILRHKHSRTYILRNSKGNLSKEAVDALLMQFNKVI